jgi:hypothetical protein
VRLRLRLRPAEAAQLDGADWLCARAPGGRVYEAAAVFALVLIWTAAVAGAALWLAGVGVAHTRRLLGRGANPGTPPTSRPMDAALFLSLALLACVPLPWLLSLLADTPLGPLADSYNSVSCARWTGERGA